jgi:hypothetical protein
LLSILAAHGGDGPSKEAGGRVGRTEFFDLIQDTERLGGLAQPIQFTDQKRARMLGGASARKITQVEQFSLSVSLPAVLRSESSENRVTWESSA